MKGLFITSQSSLDKEGGGVQRCTSEYLQCLREAGVEVTPISFKSDMRWFVRIRRKLCPQPYHDIIEPNLAERIIAEMKANPPDWIFFNHCEGLPVLAAIESVARAAKVKFAYLSHGLDSTDFLHYEAPGVTPVLAGNISSKTKRHLGAQLFVERSLLQRMDLTCCLAPTDVEIHRWLGAQRVIHLPRAVESKPLDWQPITGRVGTIATLVHAPNFHGLVDLCKALGQPPQNFRLRLVGRPATIGQQLAAEFPFIDYLGGLSDAEVAEEARTWAGFVNPIFAYPRGCSTKLSVPLEWQIPIFTSRAGARGYQWDETLVPLSDTPEALAKDLENANNPAAISLSQQNITLLAKASPTMRSVSTILNQALVASNT